MTCQPGCYHYDRAGHCDTPCWAAPALQPLLTHERVIRRFKARRGRLCGLCGQWISQGQMTVVTTFHRTTHAGCFIDARSARDGQARLDFPGGAA